MGEKSDPMIMRTKPQYAEWFSIGDERIRNIPSNISIMQPPVSIRFIWSLMEQRIQKN